MEISIVLIWAIVPLVVIGGIVFAMLAERKRRQALERVAGELGLDYQQRLSAADQEVFDRFPLAQQGHGRTATNAIIADSGELRMVIFDYKYTTGGGKNKSTHRQNVVLATSATLQLPDFKITPETFFHRFADMLGFKDIDFEDDDEFSKRFLLKGPDEQAVRELFSSERRAEFKRFQSVSVEGSGGGFIFYQRRKRRKVEQLRELMQEGFAVYGALA